MLDKERRGSAGTAAGRAAGDARLGDGGDRGSRTAGLKCGRGEGRGAESPPTQLVFGPFPISVQGSGGLSSRSRAQPESGHGY